MSDYDALPEEVKKFLTEEQYNEIVTGVENSVPEKQNG
jgi:hypothetical protein